MNDELLRELQQNKWSDFCKNYLPYRTIEEFIVISEPYIGKIKSQTRAEVVRGILPIASMAFGKNHPNWQEFEKAIHIFTQLQENSYER